MRKTVKKKTVKKGSKKSKSAKSVPKGKVIPRKTKPKTKKSTGGRPRIEVDWEEFGQLCEMQCTKDEICDWFKVSDSTLSRAVKKKWKMTFEDLYKKENVGGRISLRRMQWLSAQRGNITMQIWLGKQNLGQMDVIRRSNKDKGKIIQAIEKMAGLGE